VWGLYTRGVESELGVQAPEGVSKLSLAGLSNGQCDVATDMPEDRPQTSFRGARPSDAYGPASHLANSHRHNDVNDDGHSGTVMGTGALQSGPLGPPLAPEVGA